MTPAGSGRAAYVPGGGAAWADPWPGYAALRDHDPVHHVVPEHAPEHDHYVLSRHADVLAASVDAATYSSASGLTVRYDDLSAIGLGETPPLVMQDPPLHTGFRRLVARGFTPRQVADVEPEVRAFVRERLAGLRADGGGDLVATLFKPLPSLVVAHYLGVPEADHGRFDGWTDAIVSAGADGDPYAAAGAALELIDYFTRLVEWRRAAPGDDTVSALVHAEEEGRTADLAGILGYVFTMVSGGNDTTTGLLGAGVPLLWAEPEQRAATVADPEVLASALEELLRLTSPVQALARTLTRDVDLHGVRMPAGRRVLLLFGSGNRDPRRYGADAERLDVRRRATQILTFGQGHHHCLGAAAARLMARVTLEELLAVPGLEVDPDSLAWAPGPYVRRPTRLLATC